MFGRRKVTLIKISETVTNNFAVLFAADPGTWHEKIAVSVQLTRVTDRRKSDLRSRAALRYNASGWLVNESRSVTYDPPKFVDLFEP